MPTYFCSCGFPVKYTIAKPAECPRCGANLKAATVVAKPIAVVEPPRAASPRAILPTKHLTRARIMGETPLEPPEEDLEENAPMDAEESDVYDKVASKRLARQLVANLRVSNGIRIEGGYGNERVRFGDLVKETKEQE